ncbi:MAG: glycosyltransferase family 4 protein, partial [Sneathiella sp.]|nr:glycosyltransferase family 4 protein [Sneathiella sp.]
MKVLFDHLGFVRQQTGGISRYLCRLATALRAQNVDVSIHAPLHSNHFLQELGERHCNFIPNFRGAGKLFDYVDELSYRLNRPYKVADLVHETHFRDHSSTRLSDKTVFTVHDLTPELFPQYFSHYKTFLDRRRKAFTSDTNFIAISENTKKDLQSLFDVPDNRIHVIHHGLDKPQNTALVHRKSDTLLYVGGRSTYKNFMILPEALKRIPAISRDLRLIIFGGGALLPAELEALSKCGIAEFEHRSGPDTDLISAYREAAALVYTSEYEGFGFPLLEAMVQGCCVISSNSSSLPEVGGMSA